MPSAKKIIQHIRGIRKQPDPVISPEELRRINFIANMKKADDWKRDKEIVRDHNFAKAQAARDQQLEEKRQQEEAEAIRIELINKARIKNLKKARRVLKKQKQQEIENV